MGANHGDSGFLNARRPGRTRTPIAPTLAAAVWPADLDGLERKHGDRWYIDGQLGDYQAQRWVDHGGDDQPLKGPLKVWHETAQGLDAALTALGDLR